jgi:uncharacterized membrane protein YphA (DoxX/SURF4 family)
MNGSVAEATKVREALMQPPVFRTGLVVPFVLLAVGAVGLAFDREGAGDTAHDLWIAAASALVGLLAAVAYSLVERDRARAERARIAVWTSIRYFLAFTFVRYGAAKLVGMQFYRRYHQLDSRVIDLKPMALAWAFYGRSYPYQAFLGAAEVAAAVLLCFRRTTTLGACMLVAVLTNVVVMNFSYDVSVKLQSSLYLAMTLCVLAPERRRLWTFFFGEPSAPSATRATRHTRRVALRALVLAAVLGYPAFDIVHKALQRRLFTDDVLAGAWIVERRSGLDDLLPETAGSWDRIYLEKGDYGFFRAGNVRVPFAIALDEPHRTLRLSKIGGNVALALECVYERHDRALHLEGTHEGRAFSLDLTRDFPR